MFPVDPPPGIKPTPRRLPEAYLRAEIAAFPVAGEASFRACLLELDPELPSDDPTRVVWRACEDFLAPHTGWSLDRLISARDRGWFGPQPHSRRVPMHDYLCALARSHLDPRAGVSHVKSSDELSALDAVGHYRWLTLALPEDLLLGALGVEPAPRRVDLDPPLLIQRLMDSGVAEIHQHVGGGMGYCLLWVSALAAIATPEVGEFDLESPGAPLSDGRLLVRWLLAAAIARCTLAEFLIRRGADDFGSFVTKCVDPSASSPPRPAGELRREADHAPGSPTRRYRSWTPLRRDTLFATLEALAAGDDARLPGINPLRDLYADLHPTALTLHDAPIDSVADAFRRCDPIAARLDLFGDNAGERWLLRRGLDYLRSAFSAGARAADRGHPADSGRSYRRFARVFWQAIRVRCQYYRTVVQRPMTGGLQWFMRFYGRLGKLRNPLRPIFPEASYHVAGEGRKIRALELRTSVDDTAVEIGEGVLSYLRSWKRLQEPSFRAGFEPEFGLVFHFIKERDSTRAWSDGVPPAFCRQTHAEPQKSGVDVEHGRYVNFFAKQCRKARALVELIEAEPSCLWVIRGLDVANDELSVPTWVLVPLFRHVLDAAARVSVLRDAGPPLRVTAHVGEDFRHLLEGMRRIYEQVHYILDAPSGRLGHAMALGVEPQTWAESVGSVLMPLEERLWDLVWEWRLYTKYRIKAEYAAVAPRGRLEVLRNQVLCLASRIYPQRHATIEHLAEAHHLLHRFSVPPYTPHFALDGGPDTFLTAARNLTRSGRDERIHWPRDVGGLLEDYLDREATFRQGQTLIDVPVHADEVVALNAVQQALRRGIAQNGIVIEVNPSSNLLIGDLLDLRNHPILRLFPPVPAEGGPPPVAIAVGSDDPVTFNTQLMREYTLLHETARAAGYSERAVQDWLEAIRCTGMDARFTVSWTPNKVTELIAKLSRYLQLPPGVAPDKG